MMRRFDPARLGTLARWTGPDDATGYGWWQVEAWHPPLMVTMQVQATSRAEAIAFAGDACRRQGLRYEPAHVAAWRTAPPEPAA